VPQLPLGHGEGVSPVTEARLGPQKALRELPEGLAPGLGYLPVLHDGAKQKEHQLVGG
jgi:hypothetical protein